MEDIIILFFMLMFAIVLFLFKIAFYVYEKIMTGILTLRRLWVGMKESV
ncbi:MAG: hypothetical protein ACMV1K_13465 [Sulfurospirillum sp.]